MTKYRFTSAALSELKEATLYYEQSETGLGTAYLDEIDATIERIQRFSASVDQDILTNQTPPHARFPFGMLYQIRPDEILITAVMDLRRDR